MVSTLEVQGLGFGVWGSRFLAFGVSGLGFGVVTFSRIPMKIACYCMSLGVMEGQGDLVSGLILGIIKVLTWLKGLQDKFTC